MNEAQTIHIDEIMYPIINKTKRPYMEWCMNLSTPVLAVAFFATGLVFIVLLAFTISVAYKFIREYLI